MSTDENRKWWPGETGADTVFTKAAQEQKACADRRPDVDDGAAGLPLDELDTLLREINIEYSSVAEKRPGSSEDQTAKAAAGSDGTSQLPAFDADLEKLVSDLANESGYEDDASTRSLARKLAPRNAPDTVQSDDPDHAAGAASAADTSDDQGEPRRGRRRLRLRPARRVQGHRPQPGSELEDKSNGSLLAQQVRGAALGSGVTMLLFAAAIAAFSFFGPLNRLLPDRTVIVADNADTLDRSGSGNVDGQNGTAQADQPTMDTAVALTGTVQPGKSDDRIVQDSVIQAILKDPEKRALQADNGTGVEIRQPEIDADPVITGSITRSDSVDALEVTREASTTSTGFDAAITLDDGNADAGLGVSTDAAAANAPLPITKPKMPVPTTQQAARLDDSKPVKSASERPHSIVDRLLARAHGLLQSGDIAPARRLFHRVVAMGDSRGAKGVGMTYDPEVYKDLPVVGLTPDRSQAEAWYRKARELSSTDVVYGGAKTEPAPGLQN